MLKFILPVEGVNKLPIDVKEVALRLLGHQVRPVHTHLRVLHVGGEIRSLLFKARVAVVIVDGAAGFRRLDYRSEEERVGLPFHVAHALIIFLLRSTIDPGCRRATTTRERIVLLQLQLSHLLLTHVKLVARREGQLTTVHLHVANGSATALNVVVEDRVR